MENPNQIIKSMQKKMIYHPDKHHRRSIRLKGYDYSQVGVYFVTICIQDRDCLLGKIENVEMQLNAAGIMVYHWWNQLPRKYPNIELDEFIIMPNHLHGIIIVEADPRVCPETELPTYPDNNIGKPSSRMNKKGEHTGSPLPKPVSLSRIIQWFKTMTTNNYIRNVIQNAWHPFNKRLWQRNYYEHIVRGENELNRIRIYINENTSKWDFDDENPDRRETN